MAQPDLPLPHLPGPRSLCSSPPSTRPPAPSTWTPLPPPACLPGPWRGAAKSTSGPVTTAGELTDTKVAAYLAKYATKAAECTGTLDRRITPADQLDALPVREHARRHIAECIRLSKLPELIHLRLASWAHMLGFSGHFSTKSRTYSTTFGALRADRAAHQRDQAIAAGLLPDVDDETRLALVVTDWHFARPPDASTRHPCR